MRDIVLAINPKYGLFWINETGKGRTLSGTFIAYGLKGSADIIGVLSDKGLFVAIEVKTGAGRLREAQSNFKLAVERNNGIFITGRSVEQVERELDEWKS